TVETGIIQANSEWVGIFSLMLSGDDRPPDIRIDIANQSFADGDVVSSEPKIHAILSDDDGIDNLTRKLGISISMDGGDFEPAKEGDYTIYRDPASNNVVVNFSPGTLKPATYEVRFSVYDLNGNMSERSIRFEVRKEFEIAKGSLMNYPNPFERETDITFQLSSVADSATVKIYTVSGRLIRTLEQSHVINFVVIHWDGRDEDGKEVANGVYYYKVRLKRKGKKDIVDIGKMMKLK
ncbi:MAG: FlgD immunoglobulin-like domain containing protein, partial [Halobacteria archaeon]